MVDVLIENPGNSLINVGKCVILISVLDVGVENRVDKDYERLYKLDEYLEIQHLQDRNRES